MTMAESLAAVMLANDEDSFWNLVTNGALDAQKKFFNDATTSIRAWCKKTHQNFEEALGDPDNFYDRLDSIKDTLNKELTEMGKIKTREEILALDTINTKSFFRGLDQRSYTEVWDYASEGFLHMIPPIRSGAIRVDTKHVVVFEVTDMNDSQIEMSIEVYLVKYRDVVFRARGPVCASFDADRQQIDGITDYACIVTFGDLIADCDVAPKDDIIVKHGLIPAYKKNRDKAISEFKEDLTTFLTAIFATNYYLSKEKPKAVRRKGGSVKANYDIQEGVQRQIIRSVGPITVKSVKPPRLVTEEIVRTYHIGAWNRRGHTRTLKNGKVIYIKPTICHRKGFEDSEPGQTYIKVERK